jgi:hypothetical protein
MRHPPRRGRRRFGRYVVTIVVIVAVLVVVDFAARAAAESIMATKIQQQGLPHKPSVSIDGFPFLTQVAGRDFQQVNISTTDVPAGPVTISSIHATASDIRLSSYAFSSGIIGTLHGTALISFSSLANTMTEQVGALGAVLNGTGLALTAAGPDEVRATLNLVVTSGSATWRVSRLPGDRLSIQLVTSSGLPSSLVSAIQDVTVQIPKLPLGLTIDRIQITPAGVVGQVSGRDVPFGSN